MAIIVPIVSTFDSKGLNKAIRDIQRAEGAFNKFTAGTAAIGASLTNTGTSLSRNLTLPIVGLGTAAVKSFSDFDAALTQSTAIMSGVSEQVRDDMSNAARDVAKNLGMSHAAAAESYFFLASAGLDAQQSIAALPQVALFAKAGMFDMATATDLATDAQSALGMSSKDAVQNLSGLTRVTDVLVKANTLANASVEQFSTSLTNKAGAALKSVGKDIEEGVAVLAAFADQGIKGEEAGTQLAIVMRDLQTRGIKNADAFKQFNVSVFDSAGEMRNMGDIVGDLQGSLAGMSDEQRKMTLATMGFTDKSQGALLALIGTSDKIKNFESELRKAGGTTQSVAENQMTSFSEQVNLLQAQLTDLALDVGPVLINDFLKPLMGSIQGVVDKWRGLAPETQDAIVKFLGFVAIAGPLLIIVGKIITALGALAKAIKVVGIVLQFLTMNPIGAVILGIAALIALIVLLVQNWDQVKQAASIAMERIKEIVGEVANFVIEKFKALGEFIFENHPLLKLFRAVKEFAPTILQWFRDLGVKIFDGLRDGINSSVAGFVTAIRNGVAAGVDAVKKLLKISSPSRLFADIGKNTIAGYVNGVKSMSNVLDTTMSGVAMTGTVAFNGGISPTQSRAASGGAVINLTVNAGMGTNGAQVGREIVDAIKRFEKTSGPVFASA